MTKKEYTKKVTIVSISAFLSIASIIVGIIFQNSTDFEHFTLVIILSFFLFAIITGVLLFKNYKGFFQYELDKRHKKAIEANKRINDSE